MSSVKHRAVRSARGKARHGKPVRLSTMPTRAVVRVVGVIALLLLGSQAVAASTTARPHSTVHQGGHRRPVAARRR